MTRKLLKYKFPESNFLVIVGNFLENPQAPQGAFSSLYLTLIDYLLVALYTLRASKRHPKRAVRKGCYHLLSVICEVYRTDTYITHCVYDFRYRTYNAPLITHILVNSPHGLPY